MKKILFTALIACSMTSCLNLDPEMYDSINPGIFPKTEADADAIVTAAAYSSFSCNFYDGIFNAASGIQVCSDMSAGVLCCQWGESAWDGVLYFQNFTPNGDYTSNPYPYAKDFSKMVLAVERIKDVPMSDASKTRMLSELHMAKGWLGYLLYDYYGPVPVPSLTELNDPLADIIVPRPSKEEMVKFIEEELQAAAAGLPAKYTPNNVDYGRFTKGLANTILMKLYMKEGNWDKAEVIGRELMKPEYGYALVETSYASLFTLENEKNSEIIYSVQEDRSVSQQMWHAHVLPGPYPTKNPAIQRWNGFRVPWEFFHTFEKDDQRLEVLIGAFQGTDGIYYDESTKDKYNIMTKGAIPVKYGEDPIATGEESQVDWIVYRYADVLTLLSEAIVRQKGITAEAIDLLNQIRTRAGLKAYTTSNFKDTQDFLDKLLLEREHEFFCEGVARTDQIRHGKYIELAKARGSVTTKNEFVLMPIPQSVINEGKGKIVQNPGY